MADKNKAEPKNETPDAEGEGKTEVTPEPSSMTMDELDDQSGEDEPNAEGEGEKKEEEEKKEGGEEDPKGEKDEGEGDPEKDTITREEFDTLKTENARLLKKAVNQDKFFDRVGTEVGLLRKRTPEEDIAELDRIRDIYADDPIEGRKAHDEYLANQTRAEEVDREVSVNQMVEANREGIAISIPDFETNQSETIGELATIMAADGAPPEAVEKFKAQPYLMDQATLFNLHQRNVAVKANTAKDTEIEGLKAEIEELKKKPDQMLSRIEQASKGKTMTGKSGGAAKDTKMYNLKPASEMTMEELEAT